LAAHGAVLIVATLAWHLRFEGLQDVAGNVCDDWCCQGQRVRHDTTRDRMCSKDSSTTHWLCTGVLREGLRRRVQEREASVLR
jgi:hypothetical protein